MAKRLWQIGIWQTGSYGESTVANWHMAKRHMAKRRRIASHRSKAQKVMKILILLFPFVCANQMQQKMLCREETMMGLVLGGV